MNTSALKPFAQEARNLLREGIERRLIYWGFDKKGAITTAVESVGGGYTFRGKPYNDTTVPGKWNRLKAVINQMGFDEVVERAAYTWFNRLLAMKILSKNGYETAQLDYLTMETHTPAILEKARRGQYAFLSFSERGRLQSLLTDYDKEEEAFAILLTGYCRQQPLLQGIFGSIVDYTELLLPDDILTKSGFLHFLNTTTAIHDEDYKQVELIGWLYQFYISEKKDEVFAGFKQNKKAEAGDIPAATQIFTPNWIVKYMVQNTIGRSWLDAKPDSDLKKDWKYLVETENEHDQAELGPDKNTNHSPFIIERLNFLDPAAGSGHILVEAFDTLYPMYMAEYYNPEEAVHSILQKNLFGLELDLRAAQLAQFAIVLKAAQYSRTILEGKMLPQVYAMPRNRSFSKNEVAQFLGPENNGHVDQIYNALQTMEQSHNLGSIMVLELSEAARKTADACYHDWLHRSPLNLEEQIIKEVFPAYIPILLVLTNHFSCLAANPPYMGQKNMNEGLKNYVNQHYQLGKGDLTTVFMEVISRLLAKDGRFGLITLPSWLFLSSFEELRHEYLQKYSFESLIHMGRGVFGIDFGSVAFVIHENREYSRTGSYFRLHERNFQHIYYKDIEKLFLYSKNNPLYKFDFSLYRDNEGVNEIPENGTQKGLKLFYPSIQQINFSRIPGSPIAYWASERMLNAYRVFKRFEEIFDVKTGMQTGDNDQFIRNLYEVSLNRISIPRSEDHLYAIDWIPYSKGGENRKWYCGFEYVVWWKHNGEEIKNLKVGGQLRSRVREMQNYFKPAISWNFISSNGFSTKLKDKGVFFDVASSSALQIKEPLENGLAFLNSKLASLFLGFTNPTFNFQIKDIQGLPFREVIDNTISQLSLRAVEISKDDWNSRETSWGFLSCPLITGQHKNLEQSYHVWLQRVSQDFFQLHAIEEEINRIFIDIYGLQKELTPEVQLKDITILQEELDYSKLVQLHKPYGSQTVPVHADVIMQKLVSYIVGSYMGRYRLDKPGFHIAHANPTEEELAAYPFVSHINQQQKSFAIDDDAIIPLMGDNNAFTDDLLQRVKEFLSIVWGDTDLTGNLNFLQQQLGKDLKDYIVKDFWKYHSRTYSKKPIYWLFASKKGAFQVLVYMHRMNAYTPAKIRSKYLLPYINWLQAQVRELEKAAATTDRAGLKMLDTRRKQLVECEGYDLLLKDIADQRISFDLDDGVTKNYALFKGVVADIT